MKDIIKVENLNYKNIFKNFNLNIKDKLFISISGNNKCGKTTLIKILSGNIKTNNDINLYDKYLNDYSIIELYKKIGAVIPSNIIFLLNTVKDELMHILDNIDMDKEEKKKKYKEIIKLLKLNKYQLENPNNLHDNLKIKVELAKVILTQPKIILLDDICYKMTKEETREILDILKDYQKKEHLTIIMTTSDLNETLHSDYLYILNDGNIVLEGKPVEVLKEDNTLNKLGLNLPFMIDLSVKLMDYDLINEIELDMDMLVNKLWK